MKSTRRRAASVRKSTRTPTSFSARPSTRTSTASSVCRSSRPASIIRDRALSRPTPPKARIVEVANRLRAQTAARPIDIAPQGVFEAPRPSPYAPARPVPRSEPQLRRPAAVQAGARRAAGRSAASIVEEARAAAAHMPSPRRSRPAPSIISSRVRSFRAAADSPVVRPQRMPQIDDLAVAGAKSDPRPSRRGSCAAAWRGASAVRCWSGWPLSAPAAMRRRAPPAQHERAGCAAAGPATGRPRQAPCMPNMASVRSSPRRRARPSRRSSIQGRPTSPAPTRKTSSKSRRSCAASRADGEIAPARQRRIAAFWRRQGGLARVSGRATGGKNRSGGGAQRHTNAFVTPH